MKIGMIHLARHRFPPDVRIEKELRALCAAGHEVTVVVRRMDGDQAAEEILPQTGARVVRMEVSDPPAAMRLFSRFTLQMPEWYEPLRSFTAREAPDVFHVHDLPALPTVLHVASSAVGGDVAVSGAGEGGSASSIPVVADLHENMPAALRAYRSEFGAVRRLRHAVLFNYRLWRAHEKRALRACARVIVVVPEAAQRVLDYGVPDERIVVVSNTEDPREFCTDPTPGVAVGVEGSGGRTWVAGYVGGVGPHRGIDTVLQAMPKVLREAPEVRLHLVGASDEDRRRIAAAARRLGVADYVEVEGWRPASDVPEVIRSFDVGLVPHNDFEHTQTTVPHKLFQYMLCARPVLVSDVRPLRRIVEDTGAGLVFAAGNAESCAEAMLALRRDEAAAAEMGRRGREAASTR